MNAYQAGKANLAAANGALDNAKFIDNGANKADIPFGIADSMSNSVNPLTVIQHFSWESLW